MSCSLNSSIEHIVLDSDYDHNGYINATFAVLFLLIGCPWNALVIGVIVKKRLYTCPTYMLLLNLAIANFLVCMIVLPLTIIFGVGGQQVFGPEPIQTDVCQLGVFTILLPLVSTHTVTLLSIDRLIFIKKPMDYQTLVTPSKTFVAIVAAWVICITLCIPLLIGHQVLIYAPEIHACSISFRPRALAYLITVLAEQAVVIAIQCILCFWILCIARKYMKNRFLQGVANCTTQSNKLQSEKSVEEIAREYNRGQVKLLKIFFAIFTASIVTIFMVFALAIALPICDLVPSLLYPPTYLLYLVRAVLHPVLEAFMTPEIRSVIVKCLPKKRPRCNPTHLSASQSSKETEV